METQPERLGQLESAVSGALPADADQGAAELALTYARAIDVGNAEVLVRTGPLLLAVLESLHLTPKARAGKGAKDAQPAKSPLDELRAKRDARKRDTKAVDATAP